MTAALIAGVLFPCVHAAARAQKPNAHRSAASSPISSGFTYFADQQELAPVLMTFARSQGLGAAVSPRVRGRLSGRFTNIPPATFLEAMRSAFGVAWYRIGPTMYFYNESESGRAFITPRSMSVQALFDMLRKSSVCSPQLPPRLGGGGTIITVSGPPEYISQVTAAVAAFEESQASQVVMRVFPLKYAWAEDITVNSQDKTVVVPGVAGILRAMVTGAPDSAAKVTRDKATVDKLGGTGLASVGRENPAAPSSGGSAPPPEATAAPRAAQVNIMADPRVNAVLVNDAAYRMPYYEKVIADLDKPVELVEIHAAIVDIDSDSARSLGVTYQWRSPRREGWSGGGEFSGTAQNTFGLLPTPGNVPQAGLTLSTIYTHGVDMFLARVQALEKQGEARMLGRPSVLTVDNVQATLENTTTYYIQVRGYQAVDLFKVESGTVLRVTPHIIRDPATGRASIKLVVSVQDGQNSNTAMITPDMAIPPVKQTRITTQAIVGAEQSLLIGGYSYEQKGVDASGIPILMDIPVLGHLFKTSTKSSKRVERLILITPKIVDLNNLPPIPPRVDDPDFHTSPTRADYSLREPPGGGCTRRTRVVLEAPAPTSPVTARGGAAETVPPPGVAVPANRSGASGAPDAGGTP